MHFDLVVIGSGAGGRKAALQGAKAGKKVALIEKEDCLGGGCVHTGTLPSKSFRESVYRWALGSQGIIGQEVDSPTKSAKRLALPDMERLLRRRDRVVDLESKVVFNQLDRNHVKVFNGFARFLSKNEVEVKTADKTLKLGFDYAVIAVGSNPRSPGHVQVDGETILDSNTILNLKRVPKSMMVLGAGVIGCEYASMFLMAGTHVVLVDKRTEILDSVDREIVHNLIQRFTHHGMEVITSCDVTQVEKKKTKEVIELVVTLNSGKVYEVETILVSMGRFGNVNGLDLQNAGIEANDRGLITVDANYRTSTQNIYAVGDVVGFPALASTSMEQGRVACCHAFRLTGETATQMPENFPLGIYTIPEISMLGASEEVLRKQKVEFVSGHAYYRELARRQIVGDRWGLLKLLVDKKTLKILGIHIVGDNAAELIHIGQAVMNFGGTIHYFIQNVFNYPTLAEAYKTAAFHAVNLIHGTTHT